MHQNELQTVLLQGFRLSPQQARLWSLQQAGVAQAAQCVIALEGALDREALAGSLERIVALHEILRTSYVRQAGLRLPLQVVAEQGRAAWDEMAMPGGGGDLATLLEEQGRRVVDLEEGSSLRALLVQLGDDRHLLLLTLPSLSADARTLSNLLAEVALRYSEVRAGAAPFEDEEPVQYLQFSEWQNELLADEESAEGRRYWQERALAGVATVELPFERERLPNERFEPGRLSLVVAPALAARAEAVAEEHGIEAPIFWFACWKALLWRLSGRPDLAVRYTFHGRRFAQLGSALGLFARPLPVHVRLEESFPFDELLRRAASAVEEAATWQDAFPEGTGATREPDTSILFEFEDWPQPVCADGLIFTMIERHVWREPCKLRLACARQADGLALEILYDRSRIAPDFAGSLALQLRALVENVAACSSLPIRDIPHLSPEERHLLLVKVNETASSRGEAGAIQELFEERAKAAPQAPALVFEEKALTYAELETRANRLAHCLRRLGVRPEVPVALYLKRSADMVVSLLAVLKAGGAYIPLDPTLPAQRLAFILGEARVPVVITREELLRTLPETGARALCLDRHQSEIDGELDTALPRTVDPRNLAYVLFTSGSTGRPKGVSVEHRQVLNYLHGISRSLDLPEEVSFALVSTFAADLGNTALFPALCRGGCLHVVSHERSADAEAFAGYGIRSTVDCLKIVPSHLRALLQSSSPQDALPRRLLVLGGEAAGWDLIDRIADLAPDCRILNHYGPTETTVGVLTAPVDPLAPRRTATPTLGRPLANSRIYILDIRSDLVPPAMAGEIHIGGDGLARGYLGRPDLTAERFVPDPWSHEPGARMYRTGDLGRFLPDGSVEFLGRVDHQVKLRGFRIELGEVEATLHQHPLVRQAVVTLRDDRGEPRLVAYIAGAALPGPGELRTFLSERLPEAMIPSAFVVLDSLPLNANGKVDRGSLPAPQARLEASTGFVPPRTLGEEMLAGLWAQILKVDRVGAHDNFFDLGGHSLLGTQLISRVRRAFSVDVPLRYLFESPTVASLTARIDHALREGEGIEVPPIERVSRDRDLPLSFAQEALWFVHQMEPESAAYNVPAPTRITGRLDVPALDRSLREVMGRHEVLRTFFVTVDGRAVQRIAPAEIRLAFPLVDLEAVPGPAREREVLRLAAEEARRPFDLGRPPLLRASLLRLGPEEHAFLLTLHHITVDAWSKEILFQELAACYEAFASGRRPSLPALSIQYSDFACWQREWMQGAVLERQLAYWTDRLRGAPELLRLPTDRPRPLRRSYRGAFHSFMLPPELSASFKGLGREEDCTPFMLALAGLQALLWLYSAEEDIPVGIDIANRNRAELERVIGFFVNNLVLRTDLSGTPSFRELLRRVREVSLEAYTHQDMPFDRLVNALSPKRDAGQTPLFQVLLAFQNTGRWNGGMQGLSLAPIESGFASTKWDLVLFMAERDGALAGTWSYSTDLFDPATLDHMARRFARLCEQVVTTPDTPLAELDLLMSEEKEQLLVSVNDTARSFPSPSGVHHLFEEHAASSPRKVAVVFEDRQVTYGDLDRQANRWAHCLRRLGVGPEVRVAICLERSIEAVVAFLAVLKAGGAYVPLEPAYPQERLLRMLEDAGVSVMLTTERWLDRAAPGMQLVLLDRGEPEARSFPDSPPEGGGSPENLAYVLFTSGSTGRPKGVAVEHRQLCHYVHAVLERLALPHGSSYATVSTIAADLGNTAIFPALCTGGTLHVISSERASSPDDLADYFRRHPIDCLKIVPSHFGALLSSIGPGPVLPRRCLVLGGEAADPGLVESLRPLTNCRVVNHYGPTETTVGAMTFSPEPRWVGTSFPIGRPLANVRIHVLSPGLAPLPAGAPGELYIGGEGVARGYLRRPDLTAEKFVPDPFSSSPGARLYRTGDLVRFCSDGDVRFLGRVDAQIKLRGFRIEPGEVEAALRLHPDVRDAVAGIWEEDAGERRLVAWVVARSGCRPQADALHGFLTLRLPEHMVPSAFSFLETFPLTPNGKIDRRSLPAPESLRRREATEHVAPHSRTEELLAGIWTQLLKTDRVSVNDNFFELGGDSILMIQVIAHAARAGLRFTPRQFTENQTIAALASILETGPADPIEAGPAAGTAPLSPNQRWFFAQDFTEPHHWNQAMLAELREDLDLSLLAQAIPRALAHHDALRLRFHRTARGWVQNHAEPDGGCSVLRIDLSALPSPLRASAIEQVASDVQPSLDLAQGPLLRVALLDLGPDRPGRLLMVAHQLVIDGFGWRVLAEDVTAAYRQLAAGEIVALPPRTISYKRWCESVVESVSSGVLEEDLEAWLALPASRISPLPVDFPSQENLFSGVRVVSDWLSAQETLDLLQRAPSAYRTQIDDMLLTTLALTFAAWTGGRSLHVDLQAHGREALATELDLSRTVGWFTTCFPVSLSLPPDGGPGEALKSIKEQLRGVPGQRSGFRALRYLSTDPRAAILGSLPAPEVRFNYQGQFDQILAQGALFAPAHESTGLARSPRSRRSHLFDIHGRIEGSRLQILWRYNERLHGRSTIENLVRLYMDHLRGLIAHCVSVEEGGFTPSDFPLAGLSQARLEKLARKIGQAKR